MSRVEACDKTIEMLERDVWPPPDFESNVVLRSHALRKIPLKCLTHFEIRLGLIQQIGLKYVSQMALTRLRVDPLLEATYYPGDMLQALLHVPTDFWTEREADRVAIDQIWAIFKKASREMDANWESCCLPIIKEAYKQYVGEAEKTKWLR